MLSGFILTYNYLPKNRELRKFWTARFARVFPVYLFALLFSAPLALYSCHKNGISFLPSALAAPFLIQAWIPKTALLWNPPGWSLSVEAFFYLLFPFIAPPIARLYRRHFWVLFTSMWILSATPSLLYAFVRPEGPVGLTSGAFLISVVRYNPIFRLPEFVLGIGVGSLFLDGRRLSRPRTTALLSIICLCGLLFCFARLPYPALRNGLLAPLFAVLVSRLLRTRRCWTIRL